tara:strand:+ start:48 stop:1829 length:1782 start_codon:yes stop_codon:yes gene_type:complete
MAELTPQQQQENLEILLDLVAEALIESSLVSTNLVRESQKTIRNGLIQVGRTNDEGLVLYQKDIKANQEDLDSEQGAGLEVLQHYANQVVDWNTVSIAVNGDIDMIVSISIMGGGFPDGGVDITNFIVDAENDNPLNVSQFISLEQSSSIVDVEQAEEFLDTNIFELLPSGDTRQARVTRFFQELNALLPPSTPEFDLFDSEGNEIPDNRVDRAEDGTWIGAEQYSQDNSISYAQDNQDGNIDEEDAYFHRLKDTANSTNEAKTIQDIYNRVLPYLDDILEEQEEPQDDRPTYVNKSDGYLKFRNLNQGIIIRNTQEAFVTGLNPDPDRGREYLTTGFTISMWVRFLDKTSTGTLFNFGNPFRNQPDPNSNRVQDGFGFKLETYVLSRDDNTGYATFDDNNEPDDRYDTFGKFVETVNYRSPFTNLNPFENTDSARFVRLVVNGTDTNGTPGWLRDSHVGSQHMSKFTWNTPEINLGLNANQASDGTNQSDELRLINCTHIPEDYNEWYFINATYNPNIIEPDKYNILDDYNSGLNPLWDNYKLNFDYWMNNYSPNAQQDGGGALVAKSGYGNQCKVEIISRSDLLRARGYKV